MGTKADRPSNTESGGTTGNAKSTSTTETESGGRRGTGSRGTGGRGQAEEAGLPKLAVLEVPGKEPELSEEEKKEIKRAKDRERKRQDRERKKAEGEKPTTTRRNTSSRSSGKSKAPSMEILQLKPILMTVSTMVASREGFEIWALSETEINTLCEPIENMLAKTSALEKVGENSDAIALAIACFTIFVPKFLMWNATRKQKKAQVVTNYAKPIQPTGNTGGNKTGTTRTSSGQSNGKPSTSGQTFGGELNQLIPASAPF